MKEGDRRMKGGDRGGWREGTEEGRGQRRMKEGDRRMKGGDRGG